MGEHGGPWLVPSHAACPRLYSVWTTTELRNAPISFFCPLSQHSEVAGAAILATCLESCWERPRLHHPLVAGLRQTCLLSDARRSYHVHPPCGLLKRCVLSDKC